MANIGYESEGAITSEIENDSFGVRFTMTEEGTVDSISAFCRDDIDNAHTSRCAIYDTSGNLICESANKSDWTTTAAWGTHTVSGSPTLSDATTYYVLISFGGGAAGCQLYTDANASADNIRLTGNHTAGFPDPATFTSTTLDQDYSIYVTYTPAGGVSIPVFINHLKMQGIQ